MQLDWSPIRQRYSRFYLQWNLARWNHHNSRLCQLLRMCRHWDYRWGAEGFDDMDEHIIRDILGMSLDSQAAKDIEAMLRRCAYASHTMLRRENIEPQSAMAYYVFARVVKVMYRIGAAMELRRLGYKYEKVDLPTC